LRLRVAVSIARLPFAELRACFLREQHMICPICGAAAEQVPPAMEGVGIICPTCGAYDVSGAVIAAGQLRKLEPERRRDVLAKAKRSTQLGDRPKITSYLLD
jgi:hypothetical protein